MDHAVDTYWLVWIAAATEVGYRYDGTEYWDSFRAAIPDWADRNRDRNCIREFFKKFASTYQGLTPTGLWARQFPIIAWPITQAILPKYLQRHFTGHLFELRHLLVRGGELTLDEIGDLLCEQYVGRSSLFEGFLQQKPLTSRFVMALAMEELADTIAPIEKPTLDRIVADTDALGSVGRRLREAQRVLREARFVNSYRPGYVPQTKSQFAPPREPSPDRTEGPRLVARPLDSEAWALSLLVPNLSAPLKSAGFTARQLEEERMRFRSNLSGSGWIPSRALLGYKGDTEEPLDSYPVDDIDLFAFDRPIEAAKSVLESRIHYPARKTRLLKIQANGAAYELVGPNVRANNSYVIVTTETLPEAFVEGLGLVALKTNASPANLWRLDVPETLDHLRVAALASLGLGYRSKIRIVPAGLSPRWNTANDGVTFLDTEHPLFCITSEIEVEEFLVQLDQAAPLRVVPSRCGSILIDLGRLSPGQHSLSVSALGAAIGGELTSEVLPIDVRTASPWRSSIEGKAGVALKLEPLEAAFDQLLDGKAKLSVIAPPRRTLELNACFYGLNGELFHEEVLGRYSTPLESIHFSQEISKKLKSEIHLANVERAARIMLSVSLDELGSSGVSFEKSVEPVRWLRVDGEKIRLSDDTGDDATPTVERFELESADVATSISYADAVGGIEFIGSGGLLVATHNGRPYGAIVATTPRNVKTFSDLDIPASLSSAEPNPRHLFIALKRWNGAQRLFGGMAFLARRNAILELERGLCRSLCGSDWFKLSERVRAGDAELGHLYRSISNNSPGFGSGLAKFFWRYQSHSSEANEEFARLIELYKIPAERAISDLALKLAFLPHTVRYSELPSEEIFTSLQKSRTLVRGAFFARLSTDVRNMKSEVEV